MEAQEGPGLETFEVGWTWMRCEDLQAAPLARVLSCVPCRALSGEVRVRKVGRPWSKLQRFFSEELPPGFGFAVQAEAEGQQREQKTTQKKHQWKRWRFMVQVALKAGRRKKNAQKVRLRLRSKSVDQRGLTRRKAARKSTVLLAATGGVVTFWGFGWRCRYLWAEYRRWWAQPWKCRVAARWRRGGYFAASYRQEDHRLSVNIFSIRTVRRLATNNLELSFAISPIPYQNDSSTVVRLPH